MHNSVHKVTFRGQERRYTQLQTLDFDSTRKRMSVIVENEKGKMSHIPQIKILKKHESMF